MNNENSLKKASFIEFVILIVGAIIGISGFLMINTMYQKDNYLTWQMILAVFSWLTVFGIIILCSLIYYNIKMHFEENTKFKRILVNKQEEIISVLKKRKEISPKTFRKILSKAYKKHNAPYIHVFRINHLNFSRNYFWDFHRPDSGHPHKSS